MESATLTQFLQSICCDSPWNYAVFWKLQQQNQMLLTLEDGYYHSPRQTNSVESIVDDICFKSPDEIFSSKSGQEICDGNMGTDPVQLAVACMSSSQYKLGDGIVGEVASSGTYLWVFSDDITDGEYGSKYPGDWLFQVAVGINTLLLVPLFPQGVLQLGSLETVAEDLTVVANVKDRFLTYLHFIGCSATIPTTVRSAPVENELFGITMNGVKSEDSNDDNSIEQFSPVLPIMDQVKPSGNGNKLEMTQSSLFGISCIEEEQHAFSHPISDNLGAFGEYNFETLKSGCDMGTTTQFLLDKEASNFGNLFGFPTDCELHKALGPTIMGQTNKYLFETPISGELEYNSSSMLFDDDFINNSGSTVWETKGSLNKYDVEHSFGSVAATVNCGLEKNIRDKPINIKSFVTSVEQLSAFSKEQSRSERRTQVVQNAAQESCVTSATNALRNWAKNANTSYSPSATSFESAMSALVGEEHQKKGHHNIHPRKGAKVSSAKRSVKTGDHQKPRPRDRQLIQDRLKELRDMVPNGVKCSIDGLLDRTIQHMIFLRKVTHQADRLKKLNHQEVSGGKNWKSSDRKRGQQNGTSWAVELGNEQQLFPIIVEDLEFPGHMLIEMLCSDHGCFLDIAEVIRRLDLTILKGVLEKRSESTWATFIVEVPRGFHRLDIFWPLMQLLQ